MDWDLLVPIIVAFITSTISYFAAKSNAKSEIEKIKLLMEKDIEKLKFEHKQDLEKLEKELELQVASSETDIINDFSKEIMRDLIKSDEIKNKISDQIKNKL